MTEREELLEAVIERDMMTARAAGLSARLRDTAQRLIAYVGANGSLNAEDAADRAIGEIVRLRAENERLRDSIRNAPCENARRGETTYECSVHDPCKACEWRREALAVPGEPK